MVVFVGDRPSRLNWKANVAFVGTPSFTNLCKWITKMDVPDFTMVNSYFHDEQVALCQLINERKHTFVALGNNASKVLKELDVEHFKLPHPSPRNRQLNNKNFIDSELEKCKNYLKGTK